MVAQVVAQMTNHGGIDEMTGPRCTERTIEYNAATDGRLACSCGRVWRLDRTGWNCIGIDSRTEPW